MKKIFLSILFICSFFNVIAQEKNIVTSGHYKYADASQLWRLTQNAAGMSLDIEKLDSSANRGIAYFNYSYKDGDYHRVQEGDMVNQLQFFTERYQQIGKYLYGYGSFDFNMGRTQNRAWSDVLRTYNSNPFISGSSVFGKYDHQNIDLKAKLSSVQLGHLNYGASLDYSVGDLSRLRDPRSRVNLVDYRITPSITYSFDPDEKYNMKSALGLALHYDRRKEKIPGLTTVQTDPNLMYYVMTGLENATGTIGGYNGYMREYVNHEFGGEVSLSAYKGTDGKDKTILTYSFDRGKENVYGTNKYQPGVFVYSKWGMAAHQSESTEKSIFTADISYDCTRGYADEYRQERITTIDEVTGYTSQVWNTTFTYKKRYQMKTKNFSLHARRSQKKGNSVRSYVGYGYDRQSVTNKHLLNTSELRYKTHRYYLEGGKLFGSHLWIEGLIARGGCRKASNATITLADETTAYATNVLLPDMNYYQAKIRFMGHLQAEYQHPITIKGQTNNWFARISGDYLKTNNKMEQYQVGVSIGVYY